MFLIYTLLLLSGNIGLFGYVLAGNIGNTAIKNVIILSGYICGDYCVAGVAGALHSTGIEYCKNYATIIGNSYVRWNSKSYSQSL